MLHQYQRASHSKENHWEILGDNLRHRLGCAFHDVKSAWPFSSVTYNSRQTIQLTLNVYIIRSLWLLKNCLLAIWWRVQKRGLAAFIYHQQQNHWCWRFSCNSDSIRILLPEVNTLPLQCMAIVNRSSSQTQHIHQYQSQILKKVKVTKSTNKICTSKKLYQWTQIAGPIFTM